MIRIKHKGNFKNTEMFLHGAKSTDIQMLERYGQEGVRALSSATPIDSGETASSWDYKITKTKTGYKLEWLNGHIVDGIPVAILIQYGHGTRNSGYVQGRDFINPAIQPIFDKLAEELWREVSRR